MNRDWKLIGKVRDVVATRAFMLRVVKKDEWNVVAEIRDPLDDDPMKVFFQEKLASAQQSAKNKRLRGIVNLRRKAGLLQMYLGK